MEVVGPRLAESDLVYAAPGPLAALVKVAPAPSRPALSRSILTVELDD